MRTRSLESHEEKRKGKGNNEATNATAAVGASPPPYIKSKKVPLQTMQEDAIPVPERPSENINEEEQLACSRTRADRIAVRHIPKPAANAIWD